MVYMVGDGDTETEVQDDDVDDDEQLADSLSPCRERREQTSCDIDLSAPATTHSTTPAYSMSPAPSAVYYTKTLLLNIFSWPLMVLIAINLSSSRPTSRKTSLGVTLVYAPLVSEQTFISNFIRYFINLG